MNNFESYATAIAFRVDLSKHMVSALLRVRDGENICLNGMSGIALLRRGLIETYEVKEGRFDAMRVRLTDAGKHVAILCGLAGLKSDTEQAKINGKEEALRYYAELTEAAKQDTGE